MPDSLWSSILPNLAQKMAKGSYDTFIVSLDPVAIKNDTFILEAPNPFVKESVRQRYLSDISDELSQAAGRKLEAVVVTGYDREQIEAQQTSPSTLNSRYTFDSFVIGNSNRFAHAVAKAVSDKPGGEYNPLFIYGGVGLGKTHLMHAIGNAIIEKNPSSKVMYVTSEKFTNDLIAAIRSDKNEEFREKYRTVDILLVDDIQFIANKEGTQEEFFHTFNALYEASKHIIISSDKQPKQIPTLEERLRTRFEQGLIADIQPPDLETRAAILWKKAISVNHNISEEVLNFIATRVESNIRELEGALTRVIASSNLFGEPITVELAEQALRDYYPPGGGRPPVTPERVSQIVADYYNINEQDLYSQKRTIEIAHPRQVAMYLLRENTDLSLKKIGEFYNRGDHTTTKHAFEKISAALKSDASVRTEIEDLQQRISK